jgi:hypothetical protein
MEQAQLAKNKPSQYYSQGDYFGFCGGYAIHAILEAYGLDDGRKPWNYAPVNQHLESINLKDRLMQYLGITTPKLMKATLEENGMNAEVHSASDLSNEGKINSLKHIIDEGEPVILLVNNPYLSNGSKDEFGRLYKAHWIGVWGYKRSSDTFYIQDSWGFSNTWDDNLPVGNKERSAKELRKDWQGVLYTLPFRYLYITVSPKPKGENMSTAFKSIKNPRELNQAV